jgi:ribosomal protein L40E
MPTLITEDEQLAQCQTEKNVNNPTKPRVPSFQRNPGNNQNWGRQDQQRTMNFSTFNKGSQNKKQGEASKTSNKQQTNSTRQCLFCNKTDHPAVRCPMSIDERKNVIFQMKACMKCLRPGHYANDCRAEPCRKCGKHSHHTFLCFRNQTSSNYDAQVGKNRQNANYTQIGEGKTQTTIFQAISRAPSDVPSFSTPEVSSGGPVDPMELDPEVKPQPSIVTLGIGAKRTVTMCCMVEIFNPETKQSIEAAVFVDPGSTDTYLSDRISKEGQDEQSI